jgi:hypothetical protein
MELKTINGFNLTYDEYIEREETEDCSEYIMSEMNRLNLAETVLYPDDGESYIRFELYTLEPNDTAETVKEWCRKKSTFCTHPYDCCGNWYYDYVLERVTGTDCLIKVYCSLNV